MKSKTNIIPCLCGLFCVWAFAVEASGVIVDNVVNNEWPRVGYELLEEEGLSVLEINRKEFEKKGQNRYEYRFFDNDDGSCGVQKFGYNDWGDWDVDHFKILVDGVDVIRFKDVEKKCSGEMDDVGEEEEAVDEGDEEDEDVGEDEGDENDDEDDFDEKKVDVCHLPAGDLSKANVINVSVSAYDSHIAHGDLPAPCPEVYSGMSAWKFDEGVGEETFSVDGRLLGSFKEDNGSGGPVWGDDLVEGGSSIYFDGVGDSLLISDSLDPSFSYSNLLNASSSLSFWLKTSQVGKNIGWDSPSIIGAEDRGGEKDMQWGWIDSEGRINVGIGNDTIVSSEEVINDDEWHHVAISRDAESGVVTLYIDGGEAFWGAVYVGNGISGELSSIDFSSFGRTTDSGGGHRYYEGWLDNINVYDEVISEEMVGVLYDEVVSQLINEEWLEEDEFSFWSFDENTGGVLGDPEHSNDGVVNGAVWVDGVSGSGLEFDGVDDYVVIEKSLVGEYPFSIGAWVKVDAYSDEDQVIVGLSDSGSTEVKYGIYLDNEEGGKLAIRASNENVVSSITTDVVIYDGEWHYVVGVFESDSSRKLYLDGELVASDDTVVEFAEVNVVSVGRWSDATPDSYFDGVIDEVSVWKSLLVEEEVVEDYEDMDVPVVGSGILPDEEYSSWSLNEGGGTVLSDVHGNNAGTISGAQWVEGVSGMGLELDGVDDYAEVSKSLIADYPFTMESWIKSSALSEDQVILGLANSQSSDVQYGLYITGDGSGRLAMRGSDGVESSDLISNVVVGDGEWHHVVGVFNSDTGRELYVDGVLVASDDQTIDFTDSDVLGIGRWADATPDSYFDGTLDEVKFYSRSLEAEEILWRFENITIPVTGYGLGLAYLSSNKGESLTANFPEQGLACGRYTSVYRKFNFWKTRTLDMIRDEKQTLARMIYFDCDLEQYVIAETDENLVGLDGNSPTIVDTVADFADIDANLTAEDRKLYIDRESNTVKVGTLEGGLVDLEDQGTIMDDLAMQEITDVVAGVHYYNSSNKRYYIGTAYGTLEQIFIEH